MTTTVDLLAATAAHLAEYELRATASLHLTEAMAGPQVTVQLSCRTLSAIAQGLLAWADTLTEVSAQAWRVSWGDSMHLSVTGRLPGGIAVLVYGRLAATGCTVRTDLSPDATAAIPLAALRHAASEGEVMA